MSFMDLAARMIGVAELGEMKPRLEGVLARHRVDVFPKVGAPARCAACGGEYPCDTFTVAAVQLRLIELLDGTRTSTAWPGPVEERPR